MHAASGKIEPWDGHGWWPTIAVVAAFLFNGLVAWPMIFLAGVSSQAGFSSVWTIVAAGLFIAGMMTMVCVLIDDSRHYRRIFRTLTLGANIFLLIMCTDLLAPVISRKGFLAIPLEAAMPIIITLINMICVKVASKRTVFDGTKCPQCGYDLRGLRRQGCPECGWGREDYSPSQAAELRGANVMRSSTSSADA